MKYGYKEIRKIEPHALRKLCIKNDWYTNGTNEEYAKLFDMIEKDNITTEACGAFGVPCENLHQRGRNRS